MGIIDVIIINRFYWKQRKKGTISKNYETPTTITSTIKLEFDIFFWSKKVWVARAICYCMCIIKPHIGDSFSFRVLLSSFEHCTCLITICTLKKKKNNRNKSKKNENRTDKRRAREKEKERQRKVEKDQRKKIYKIKLKHKHKHIVFKQINRCCQWLSRVLWHSFWLNAAKAVPFNTNHTVI